MKLFLMFSWVLGQLPPRKSAPIPKTKPKPNLNLNRGWGGAIFLAGNSVSQTLTLTGLKLKGLVGASPLLEGKVNFPRRAMIPLPFTSGSLSAYL